MVQNFPSRKIERKEFTKGLLLRRTKFFLWEGLQEVNNRVCSELHALKFGLAPWNLEFRTLRIHDRSLVASSLRVSCESSLPPTSAPNSSNWKRSKLFNKFLFIQSKTAAIKLEHLGEHYWFSWPGSAVPYMEEHSEFSSTKNVLVNPWKWKIVCIAHFSRAAFSRV